MRVSLLILLYIISFLDAFFTVGIVNHWGLEAEANVFARNWMAFWGVGSLYALKFFTLGIYTACISRIKTWITAILIVIHLPVVYIGYTMWSAI